MMTFEGKKEVEDYVNQGATLYNQLLQMQQQMEMLMRENMALKGMTIPPTEGASPFPTTQGRL
jgi:hypothetical protein